MRISSALMAAACMLSGIVVLEAAPAAAQSYSGSAYSSPGYQTGYRTSGYTSSYAGPSAYEGSSYDAPGYQGRGYDRPTRDVTYGDDIGYRPVPRYGYASEAVSAPVYETRGYQTSGYDAPRYVAPTYSRPTYAGRGYSTPVVVEAAPICNERGW